MPRYSMSLRKALVITIAVSTAGWIFMTIQRSLTTAMIARYQGFNAHSRMLLNSQSTEETAVTSPSLTSCNTTNTNEPKKRTNVVFLKVHKAGSTTVMNIFLRFGVSNNLNIVLPTRESGGGFNYLGYGKTLHKKNIVPIPYNETYNILCNHVVYNREAFRQIMPTDTEYVGILREPLSHFVSASLYYGFIHTLMKRNITGGQMSLNLPSDILHEYLSHLDRYTAFNTAYVRNRMSFDFGLPVSQFNNKSFITEFITNLEKDFKLVMIMEYFSESLVLMKRYLHWGLEDILYVPLNINQGKRKKTPIVLTSTDKHILSEWNYADFRLYDYFKARFLRQITAEGPSFQDEVKNFRAAQQSVEQFCSELKIESDLKIPKSVWNQEIHVSKDACRIMTMPEIPMMKNLIQKAKDKYQKLTQTFLTENRTTSKLRTVLY